MHVVWYTRIWGEDTPWIFIVSGSLTHSHEPCAYSPHSKLAAFGWLTYTTYVRSMVFCLRGFIMMRVMHICDATAIEYANLLGNKKTKKMSHSKLAALPTPTIMPNTPSLRIYNQEPLIAVRSQV